MLKKLNNEKKLFQNKLNTTTQATTEETKADKELKNEDADLILDDYQRFDDKSRAMI